MAVINPPAYVQALSYPADSFRRAIQGALRGGYGVETYSVGGGDLLVTQTGTPSMAVLVAAGRCFIPGTQNVVSQGVYECLNDAPVTLAVTASDPTNPRIDLVVAQVEDAAYSGANNDWKLAVITGTPAGTPVAPTAPANSITLASLTVAALVTSITNANITDSRPALITTATEGGSTVQATLSGSGSRWTGSSSAPSGGNAGDWVMDPAGGFLRSNVAGTWRASGRVKIAETLLSSTIANITISSIPQNFKHLAFRVMAAGDQGANQFLYIRFNGDGTAVYHQAYMNCTSPSFAAGGTGALNVTAACVGRSGISGNPMSSTFDVVNYSSTTTNKDILGLYVGSSSVFDTGTVSGNWHNATIAGVSSILLYPGAGNFTSGTYIAIYGDP